DPVITALMLALFLATADAQDGKTLVRDAVAAAERGEALRAEALFMEALRLDPTDERALLAYARFLEGQNYFSRALASFKNPSLDTNLEALGARVRLLEKTQRFEEALRAVDALLEVVPGEEAATARRARLLERVDRYQDACDAYQQILDRHPDDLEARLGLGRTNEELGDLDQAMAAYQRVIDAQPSPDDVAQVRLLQAAAVEAQAQLVEVKGEPVSAARLYLRLLELRPEVSPRRWELEAARLLCEEEPEQASALLGDISSLNTEGAIIFSCIANAYYVRGETLLAGRKYSLLQSLANQRRVKLPREIVKIANERVSAISLEGEIRDYTLADPVELSTTQLAEVRIAQGLARKGEREDALIRMRAVVAEASNSAEAWGLLGDMQARLGIIDEAELSYRTAIAIDQADGRWYRRLGLLLAEHYAGRRHLKAIDRFDAAMAISPDLSALHYERGQVFAHLVVVDENTYLPKAIADLSTYLEEEPDGPYAEAAQQLLGSLQREEPTIVVPDITPSQAQDVPEAASYPYRKAVVLRGKGEEAQALSAVREALDIAPQWARALNLLADLTHNPEDPSAAIDAWRRSLGAVPDQPRIQLRLGLVLHQQGEDAQALDLIEQSAAAGLPRAHFVLADLEAERGAYEKARRHLNDFFAVSTGGPDFQLALALQKELEAPIQRRLWLIGGVLTTVGLSVVGFVGWRRQQRTLEELVEEAPECAHDLARLLAAIRHEVLKHNTTLLEEMAYAFLHNDFAAVRWGAERLFGEDDGAVHRYAKYIAAIERLGKKHGVSVDLRRKDPVFAPMSRAIKRLIALEPSLRQPESARDLDVALHELSTALNEDAYRALGRLIQQMGTLPVHAARLEQIDARVRAEPGIAEEHLPPLTLSEPDELLLARVFQGDFEDIVANLLRNAYLASIERLPAQARQVALRVEADDDPITGLEEVVLRFCDRAPGELTDAMIQGRSIGRGLGLVVDLITRHNGSITVESEPGWSKAVVVRLPRAEADPTDAVVEFDDEEDE
ncbi:MAG: tetratricopeptide repeat protein, partial [Myxococcota bacterium]